MQKKSRQPRQRRVEGQHPLSPSKGCEDDGKGTAGRHHAHLNTSHIKSSYKRPCTQGIMPDWAWHYSIG
ncbi:hypothetical protein OUZ56_002048 [Daphnia magna]|uniref:Uncharacterized protein n=1 Tax=Daphnia magna TaxID=35525 RepID=A0ABR0A4I9_9CRUS|nr:hypothetical protein OUZ56_002048 [Daphnia magna]